MPISDAQLLNLRVPETSDDDVNAAIRKALVFEVASAILARTDQRIEIRQGDDGDDDEQKRDSAAVRMAVDRARRLIRALYA